MQDAFSQDMFNISDLNNPRYNGHVQSCGVKTTGGGSGGGLSLSVPGNMTTGGKKDRKGCTKGKIEAIMKNNAVRTKVVLPVTVSTTISSAPVKKSLTSTQSITANHQQQSIVFVHNQLQSSGQGSRHEVVRVKDEHDDPYTFTEAEPQSVGIYQASGSGGTPKTKTISVSSAATSGQHHRSTNTVVTGDRNRAMERNSGVKAKSSQQQNVSSLAPGTGIEQPRTGKVVQTVAQETANRSPRTVPKRKVPSVSLKSTTGGPSSYNSQGQYQEQGSIKSHYHHYHRRSQQPDRVCLPAKRQPRKSVWQRERNAKHELLERIQGVRTKLAAYSRDLYPLGVEISDSESDEFDLERRAVYERHWFSRTDTDVYLLDEHWNKGRSSGISSSVLDVEESPRERRVEFARAETRRRLAQTLAGVRSAGEPSSELVAAVVRAARVVPNATAVLLSLGDPQTCPTSSRSNRGARFLTTGEKCSYSEGCVNQALPATRHCLRHIMYNVDQRLFSHCTGRLEDNTQCNRPTFDPAHVSPLCPLHSDQAQANAASSCSDSSRHSRKKNRILGMSRNSKRNNKKKKKPSSPLAALQDELRHNSHHHHHHHHHSNHSNRLSTSFHSNSSYHRPTSLKEEQDADSRGETSLGMLQHSVATDTAGSPMSVSSTGAASQSNDHLGSSAVGSVGVDSIVGPSGDSLLDTSLQHRAHSDIVEEVSEEVLAIEALDPVELANQTTRLLEEHDLNNVLNQISTDLAFNDLFTDKNGEYEPTREETEELERALEAVDNDVRSLERMTRALPLTLPLLQLPLEGLLDTAPATSASSTSPPDGAGNGNFDSTATTSPTVAVSSFHNGYVSSAVSLSAGSSTVVSDSLHQAT
ncbi:uncharacterized protein isoform X2 [Rhodnius prolixus]|uniref:uncharacterized protein isoform X2 n=1 Tax=Rhodnius prolixus TaxID=13249 RepID=UPI003D187A7C